MSRRFVYEWLLPTSLLGIVTWAVWFGYHDLLRSYDYVSILGDHFHYLRQNILRGEIPWWNPYVALGRPFFTDIHFGTFYPPTYLLLLGERCGCFLIYWSHLTLLFAGVRCLAGDLGVDRHLATVVAFASGLTGCFAARMIIGQVLYGCALCWLPWFLIFTLRLGPRWSWRNVTGLVVSLTFSFLCGNANAWWILCVGTGFTFLFREFFEGRADLTKRLRGRAAQFTAALLLSVGITAVAWLPYLDLVENANRMTPSYEFADAFTAVPSDLLSFIAAPSEAAPFNWEHNFFVGALWFMAGICGIVTTRDARLRALAATSIFAVLYSLGDFTPLHRICFEILPGAAGFRIPSRMGPWAAIALLLLGASFFSRPERSRRIALTLGTIAALFLVGAMLARLSGETRVNVLTGTTFAQITVAIVAMASVNRWCTNRRHQVTVVALLTGIEIAVFIFNTRPIYTFKGMMGVEPEFPIEGELSHLRESLGRTPGQPPPRVNLPGDIASANSGTRYSFSMLDGDTPLYLERPWRFLHAVSGVEESHVYRNTLPTSITAMPARSLPLITLNLSRSTMHRGFMVTPDSFPRAFLTTSLRSMPDEDAVLQALRADFPTRYGVLGEGAPLDDFGDLDQTITAVPIRQFENNRILMNVTNEVPAALVLNEPWFPGWIARDGIHEIQSEPMDLWMRGFRLPPGTHHLEIVFRPRHFGLGGVISLLTAAVFALARFRRPDTTSETAQ